MLMFFSNKCLTSTTFILILLLGFLLTAGELHTRLHLVILQKKKKTQNPGTDITHPQLSSSL